MITFTGVHCTREFGAPTLRDIAVQSMRIPRFAGSTGVFYPVGMHLLLVADLLPAHLEHHGLLHDAAEVCVSDIPRPMKTRSQRAVEHRVLRRIYASLGLRYPTQEEEALVKTADMRAVNAEGVRWESGPRGFADLQPAIDHQDREATEILSAYLKGWDPACAINADGYWPILLERRLRKAINRVHKKSFPTISYTCTA